MENTINERINAILHQSKYRSIRSFAERIDVAPTSLNGVINGAEPRYSTLYKILSVEPSISAEWLMRGEGNMLRTTDDKRPRKINLDNYTVSNETSVVAESSYTYGSSTTEKEYIAMLRKKDEQIDRLTRVIERLTSKL